MTAAAVSLTACAGGTRSSAGGASASSTARPASAAGAVAVPSDFCTLLSAAEISRVMGHSYPAPVPGASGGGEQDCDSSRPGAGAVSFSIFGSIYCHNGPVTKACLDDRSSTFATDKRVNGQNHAIADIPGLGDNAYCASRTIAGVPTADVAVLKGWIFISVGADTCAHARSLATLLLSRVR